MKSKIKIKGSNPPKKQNPKITPNGSMRKSKRKLKKFLETNDNEKYNHTKYMGFHNNSS